VRKRVKTANLSEDAFTKIEAGQTLEFTIDMAAVHDLSAGGNFKVATNGAIPYAEAGSTNLAPGQALIYNSNELHVRIDGQQAAKVKRAFELLDKRTTMQSDCTSTHRANVLAALQDCRSLASAASNAASSGSASKYVLICIQH
jgi:deuterolysin